VPLSCAALALALALGSGCAEATRSLGDSPGEGRHALGELLGSVAARFGPRERDSAYVELRAKLVRAALVPSRIFDDASAWTTGDGPGRGTTFGGGITAGRYRIGIVPRAGDPRQLASYRGRLRLDRLAPGAYRWRLHEELAVGPVTGERLDRAFRALLLAAQHETAADLAPILRRQLPRTTIELGNMFTLRGLANHKSADGVTQLDLDATLELEPLSRGYPRYARYLEKYVMPVEMQVVARDHGGYEWWRLTYREGRLRARIHARDGRLHPFAGPARRCPRELLVTTDLSTKVGLFRVGVEGLKAQVTSAVGTSGRSVSARLRDEPRWLLPFVIRPLMRSSLRRPFRDEGASIEGVIQDGAGAQTLLVSRFEVAVQESWIVRWLGRFIGGALSAYRRGVEQEADQLVAKVLLALRTDLIEGPGVPAARAGRIQHAGIRVKMAVSAKKH
jgi:hypothetical protein